MAKWFMAVWGEKRRKNTVEVAAGERGAAEVVARESEVEMNKRLCFVSEKQKGSRLIVILLFLFNLNRLIYFCQVALIHEMKRKKRSI
jgi:hypothetical protein